LLGYDRPLKGLCSISAALVRGGGGSNEGRKGKVRRPKNIGSRESFEKEEEEEEEIEREPYKAVSDAPMMTCNKWLA